MSNTNAITAIIVALNEEQYLRQCIESVRDVVHEVLVIDTGSTDQTQKVAIDAGARVLETTWQGYAETKNWAQAHVSTEFVFSLDADERVSDGLKKSIEIAIQQGLHGVFSMNRLNNYCGKWMRNGGLYPDRKIRIYPKEVQWKGMVHENLETGSLPKTHLQGDLLHFSIESRQDHIERERKYASMAKAYSSSIHAFFASCFRFIKTYFFKLGFLDGKLGFQYCLISAKSRLWRNKS